LARGALKFKSTLWFETEQVGLYVWFSCATKKLQNSKSKMKIFLFIFFCLEKNHTLFVEFQTKSGQKFINIKLHFLSYY